MTTAGLTATSPAWADGAAASPDGTRTAADVARSAPHVTPRTPTPSRSGLLGTAGESLPSDPKRQDLDGVYNAWRVTHGSASVKVAVIDSGIKTTHPDLVGKVVGQYNAVTGSHSAPDGDGQGTAVASIIGANTDNGVGMAGIGWNTTLLDVRVSDSHGVIRDVSIAKGIDWAVAHGASVINISLYQPESNAALKAAVARAVAKDVVVVAMTGDQESPWKTYPAAYPGVLGVAASTDGGLRGRTSPSGAWVDLAAAFKMVAADASTNGYANVSGSTYAAAQVSGFAALIRAAHPDYTAAQVRTLLTSTATGYRNHYTPAPVLNGFAAVGRNLSTPGPNFLTPPGTVLNSGSAAWVDVHLEDFVSGDGVVLRIDGQVVAEDTHLSVSSPKLWVSVLGLKGPHTLEAYRCMGGYCSTSQPSTLAIDVENDPPTWFVYDPPYPAGDLALGNSYNVALFANGVRVRTAGPGEDFVPVDLLPQGNVELVGRRCFGTVCEEDPTPPVTRHIARLDNPTLSLSRTSVAIFAPSVADRTTRLTFSIPGDVPVETRLYLGNSPTPDPYAAAEQPIVDLGMLAPGTHTYDWKPPTAGTSRPMPVVVETTSPEGLVGRARARVFVDRIHPKASRTSSTTTVYPVHDGYLDVAQLAGRTNAPGTLDVVISKGGRTVAHQHLTVGSSKTYRVDWNGRSSTGAVLAEGSYHVSITPSDTFGARGPSTAGTFVVSHRKLVTKTQAIKVSPARSSVPAGTFFRDKTDTCSKVNIGPSNSLKYLPCPKRYVETFHQVMLPLALRYVSLRVAVSGAGTHSNDAYLGFSVPGFTVRWKAVPRSSGSHWGAAAAIDDTWLWPSRHVRWTLDDENGDTYVAKSFTASVRYQVLG